MKTEIKWLEYKSGVELDGGYYFLLIHHKHSAKYQIGTAFLNPNTREWNIKSIGSGFPIPLNDKAKIKYYAKHFGQYGHIRKSEVDSEFRKSNGTPVGLHETPFITGNGV